MFIISRFDSNINYLSDLVPCVLANESLGSYVFLNDSFLKEIRLFAKFLESLPPTDRTLGPLGKTLNLDFTSLLFKALALFCDYTRMSVLFISIFFSSYL